MNDLRSKAYSIKVSKRLKELGQDKLTTIELEKIATEVSNIRLAKFDDTKDYRGCLYSGQHKSVIS